MEKLAELGDVDGAGWVDLTGAVAIADGRILVVNKQADHEIRTFSPDGGFLGVTGREGEGPGDFRGIRDIHVDPDGTVHLLEYGNRRISVLDSTLRFMRAIRLPGRPLGRGLLPLADGSYILNAVVPTAELIGLPVHLIGADGDILVTFDGETSEARPDRPLAQHRQLGASGDTAFWSARLHEYRLDQYGVDGSSIRTLVVQDAWEEVASSDLSAGASRPAIMDVQEDRGGRVWILSRTPDPRWEDAVAQRWGAHGLSYEIETYHDFLDTIVDVIDPERGRLLARLGWDGYAIAFVAPGVLVSYDDSTVIPRLVLWRVRLIVR